MRVFIIPDSFKENLSASQAADAIEHGIHSVDSNVTVEKIPFSDGGEGALDVLAKHAKGKLISCNSLDAMGKSIIASYFIFESSRTAWVELSQVSGLALIPKEKRDVLNASTYGTGLLIRDAIERGCVEIILGVGGSATNDGGAGIYQALGGCLTDKNGKELLRGGGNLSDLHAIIPPSLSTKIRWKVACDVENLLLGEGGASKIYGPQKGASKENIILLEAGLSHFSKIINHTFCRDISTIKGGGAAGGTAAGMYGFFNASLESGFSILSKMIHLESKIKHADLIFTAEGKMDCQSINGKLTVAVAQLGKKYKIPVIGLAGAVEPPYTSLYDKGFAGIFSIQNSPMSMENSKKNAAELLKETASRVYHLLSKKR